MNKTDRIRKTSVLQHDSSDCGVACLASVIRYNGGETTLDRLRNLSGTGKTGTSMLGLYQAAEKHGILAEGYEATVESIKEYEHPLILHVLIDEKLEHYILSYGFENGHFLIWDPARGFLTMKEQDLDKIWKSKKCLSVRPGSNFEVKSTKKGEKRRWLLSMLKPDKDLLLVSVILGILFSLLGMVMAIYSQKLIDKILPSGKFTLLFASAGLVLLLLIVRIAISGIRQLFLLSQGKLFNVRVVDDFFTILLDLPKWFFDTRKTGDFVARLNDTMRIQKVIADIVSIYIIDILVLILTTGLMFYYSVEAGLLSLVCLPIIYFIIYRMNNSIKTSQHEMMSAYAMNESNFIDSVQGILTIKNLGWKKYFIKRNNLIYSDFQEKAVSLGKIKITLSIVTGVTSSLYLIILLIWSSMKVMSSELTPGELMAIISLGSTLLPSLLNLALITVPITEAKVAINRMFEFTQIESEANRDINAAESIKIDTLELRSIFFRYPGQKLLLEDINLVVKKGEIVSLAGESGSGKSTLASIILKHYDYESGEIVINNNINATAYNLNDWRSKISLVPQDIHIFSGTILQNLISDPDETKLKYLLEVLEQYGLTPFYNNFPSGLLTIVGEEGINLSGGQKQLIAFTRAILQSPDIMIIDEGTANMDRITEIFIHNLIVGLKCRMGILLISHKINILKDISDKICVLEGKTIKYEGTHDELMEKSPTYIQYFKDFKQSESESNNSRFC